MAEYMTIKELAEVAGVSIRTIQKVAKRLYPKKIKERYKTLFDLRESADILRHTNKKNKVYYKFTEI